MIKRRAPRLSVLAASVAAALAAGLLVSAPADAKPGSCGRKAGCTKFELIHAGSTYGWWPETKRYEFKTAQGTTPPPSWRRTGTTDLWAAGKVGSGTLAVKMAPDSGDSYSDWTQSWVNGRWEVRFRSMSQRDAGSSTIPVRNADGYYDWVKGIDANIRLELVPAGTPAQRCSPTSVLMAGYNPAVRRTATIGVTTPTGSYAGTVSPWSQVSDLSSKRHWTGPVNSKKSAWHVWGVELKPTTITWFMDGKVTRRAPRPASTRNVAFTFRESILGSTDPSVHTAFTSTQMDWARYWTLKKTTKNKKKRKALAQAPVLPATAATKIGPC